MLELMEDQNDILSVLRNEVGREASKEKLFGLVFDLFQASADKASPAQLDMCEDVLTQLIGFIEVEARRRIAEKLASMERAPRRVMQCLAVEPIHIAQPVLCKSMVLQDEDLLMVTRLCGPQHLEAIAERKTVSLIVTNELMRLGTVQVWERLAQNSGAQLAEKSIAFLANRPRENVKIQMGLIERPDLPEAVVTRLIAEAGESIRTHLQRVGRQDLLQHLDRAKAIAKKRVLSTSSVLGFEFDTAYQEVLRHEKMRKLTHFDLMDAARKNQFPRGCCIFSRLSGLELEDAVHWLSRREVDPAIVAFKALNFEVELVEALLKAGPWGRILTNEVRAKAMRTFNGLKPDVAKRIFDSRGSAFNLQKGTA